MGTDLEAPCIGQLNDCAARTAPLAGRWIIQLRIGPVRAINEQKLSARQLAKTFFGKVVRLAGASGRPARGGAPAG